MKRFHVHIAVDNMPENIRFYAAQSRAWIMWAIQVDSQEALDEMNHRLIQAGLPASAQNNAQCCYAASNKHWTVDPQGIAWEAFHTLTAIPVFGQDTAIPVKNAESCCAA